MVDVLGRGLAVGILNLLPLSFGLGVDFRHDGN
jgi:hypothetical protein